MFIDMLKTYSDIHNFMKERMVHNKLKEWKITKLQIKEHVSRQGGMTSCELLLFDR
jgi:hypothetical protein